MNRPWWKRLGGFAAGKGFYIVLFLCVATIGISGYYLVDTMTHAGDGSRSVAASPRVQLPDSSEEGTPDIPDMPRETSEKTALKEQEKPDDSAQDVQPEEKKAEPTVQAAPAVYVWPVQGAVVQPYCVETLCYDPTMDDWRAHPGVDLAAPVGTMVGAMRGGTVLEVRQDDLLGTTVVIDHGDSMVSRYSNLAAVTTVQEGDQVEAGDPIGSVGQTALGECAQPPHVHVELTRDGDSLDPMKYLPGA